MGCLQIGTIYPHFSYLGYELSLIAATRGISGHHVYLKVGQLFHELRMANQSLQFAEGVVAGHYLYQNEFTK